MKHRRAAPAPLAPKFRLGVNYWPARSATAMWERFDPGEIAADFAHIAALGLDTVRVFLRWDLFQPQIDRVDPTLLGRLETVVALAADARLHVMPTLFCGNMSEINVLPEWALDRNAPRSRYRTFVGDRESPLSCGNMYSGALLDAQVFFCRAVSERLHAQPAIAAWDIGHKFSNVREPSHVKVSAGEHSQAPADERQVAEWSRRLTEALQASTKIPVTAGTHSGDLLEDRDVRLSSLCAPFAFASMQADSVSSAFARSRLDSEMLPFLTMLTAGFSYKPVLVTGFGGPTCPTGKFSAFEHFALPGEPPNMTISSDDSVFAPYPCLTEDENAASCGHVLERLYADGRLGALWWCWSDYADALAAQPPFDQAPHARTYGIVRADGTEKPIAAALRAFAARGLTVQRAHDMPMIASAYYYRTLPTSTTTLYESYLGFVHERRANITA